MRETIADILVAAHALWALWMVSGVILALLGFVWPRLWGLKKFRISHLVGLLLTASTPIWADGICPLTTWEYELRESAAESRSLLGRFFQDLLYWDVPLVYLSLMSVGAALATVAVFILRPPWRKYT